MVSAIPAATHNEQEHIVSSTTNSSTAAEKYCIDHARQLWGGPVRVTHQVSPDIIQVDTPGHGGYVMAVRDGNAPAWAWDHGAPFFDLRLGSSGWLEKVLVSVAFEEDVQWAYLFRNHPGIVHPAVAEGRCTQAEIDADIDGILAYYQK